MSSPKTNRRQTGGLAARLGCAAALLASWGGHAATLTNNLSASLSSASLPETGPSLLRVLGALSLVLGLFLGGAWLVRNGRFSVLGHRRSAKLNLLETRSLGGRQALHVVAYGQERFLIGSTPAGINLLSHLAPPADGEDPAATQTAPVIPFAQALAQVLRGNKHNTGKSEGAGS
jgi:flagellar biogenesis protein FliO